MAIHLVTGGKGFIGSRLVDKLLEQGHHVRVLDILSSSHRDKRVEYLCGSILDVALLREVLRDVHTTHHLAASVPLGGTVDSFQKVNVLGTENIFKISLQQGVKHFNFMSSSAVYGNTHSAQCPIFESASTIPFEAYGKSKRSAEEIILGSQTKTMSCAILRPRTVLGPGRMGIFDLLFNWIFFNKPIYLIGNGENQIQLLHVDDLAEACIRFSSQGSSGIFNLGTAHFGTLNQAVLNLSRNAGKSNRIVYVPTAVANPVLWCLEKTRLAPFNSWHRQMLYRDCFFDIRRAQEVAQWQPRFSNDEMLLEAYHWYERNYGKFEPQAAVHRKPLKRRILSLFMN